MDDVSEISVTTPSINASSSSVNLQEQLLGESERMLGGDYDSGFMPQESAATKDLTWRKLWEYDKGEFLKRITRRAPYYLFPIAIWLPRYEWRKNFLSDVSAGIGVGFMLVPQGLAYSIIAGVPPVMGLYTALFPLLVFALLTTSRHMHFGPDALAALLVGQIMLSPQYEGEENQYLAPIFSFICGITLLVMGIVRIGFLDNILSKPLLSGFVNAVAVIIIVNQIEPFLGLPPLHQEQAWEKVYAAFMHIKETHLLTLAIGVTCLTILIFVRVLKWRFPNVTFLKYIIDTVIVVALGTALSYSFNLSDQGVKILGAFPNSLPTPQFPRFKSFAKFQTYYVDAIVICIIGFVESIVTSKIYATRHNYSISPNRELVAMGAANIFGSFFHTFPAFGSLTRSAVGDFLGSTSQLFAFVSAIVVFLTIMFLGPIIYYLPRVAMSAIIIVAAYSLFEVHDLVFLWGVRAWKELALLCGTFLITLALGVDAGIFIGVGVSLLMVVAHTTVPHITVLGKTRDGRWVDATKNASAELDPETQVVRIEDALYFANIAYIKEMFKRIEIFGSHRAHPTSETLKAGSFKNLILHCKHITTMDPSASKVIADMIHDYEKRGVAVYFVKLREEMREQLAKCGVLDPKIFDSIDAAVASCGYQAKV